ncbi:MAG TPA: hypothetical protein VHB77_11550 [Planctomycetaceae bacterium]|nr:hypothetical protein [Planctomycetaceae bacterium]
MNFPQLIGRLLGIENVQSIDQVSLSFGAAWAERNAAWLLFGCLAVSALAGMFYLRFQPRGKPKARLVLAVTRALLLSLILMILADPVMVIRLVSNPRPLLWVLFDGTDSMAIEDEMSDTERSALAQATGVDSPTGTSKHSRQDYVRAMLAKKNGNLFEQLEQKYRLKPFVFDRGDGVRALESGQPGREEFDARRVAEQLGTTGQVTALGKALEDLSLRHATSSLDGLLVISDFEQNSGPPPLAPAKRLGVPIYTIGVGPEAAVDIAIELQAPLLMKKAERTTLTAVLRQTGLKGQKVNVAITARRLSGGGTTADDGQPIPVAQRTVSLDSPVVPVEFPFEPSETGRFIFAAEVDPQPGEVVEQNNRVEREVNIRDDFLRLMFVEYEPTWEWRFIKEVFHRDKLVGMRGFRTYLRSADPKVRETNELFLPTLTPKRSEFFANDVIFLGDMPASTLSTRFCEMTKEFVDKFGGGLVVIAGPRFGPGQLANTPLAEMLPVVVDPDARIRDNREFKLQLTPDATSYDFMQLGIDAAENAKAWDNMGKLPWYQPVSRLTSGATALAVHPSDSTIDLKKPQPLIAIRQYGKGQVVYLGFDETWRLRRKYGEQYYRQFWGQMIHRLGLSHALGSQKRFVVRTDRQQYQADDKVVLTIEAYDANFEPLNEESFPDGKLSAELIRPGRGPDGGENTQALSVAQTRDGIFETRIPVFEGGEYRVRIADPITSERSEVFFSVTSLSAERRSAVRNVGLQTQLSTTSGGRAYTLTDADKLLSDFNPVQRTESSLQVISLWNTWLCFGLVVALMLGEWLLRKWVNLP